jgi:RNA polymerase sigma-70 factor (ECF subfamily)
MNSLAASFPDTVSVGASSAQARDDHALVRSIQRGDEEAFRDLFERHERRAFGVAYQLLSNAEAARDVVQEAFLRVYRAIDRFDFRNAFTTWLYRIVVNLAIDGLRRQALLRPAAIDDVGEIASRGPRPEETLAVNEVGQLVRRILDRLPPKFRTVIVLRELQGLSSKEIAAIVGTTHSTVRWRLHRARRIFKEIWERAASEEKGRESSEEAR